MPRCLQLSRPHIFWQIGCEAFTTDAHIAKIISAKLPLWPARGTWQAPFHASLYQTKYFQDNANYDKFHHPALCAFPLISLIRENRGGSHGFSWGACCLIEWCWNHNPQPPLFPHSSCDHLVSSVFSYFDSAGLVSTGALTTWPKKPITSKQNAAGKPSCNCHKWSKRMCLDDSCRLGPWCKTSHLHERKQI